GEGDDILIARHAGIRLSGGPGEDIFIPRNINGRIVISDFEFGRDQLDLSQLGMVRSLYQIRFHEFDGGISLRFHDARIDILTHNGRRLTESNFTNDLFPITHYTPPVLELDEPIPSLPPSDTGEHIDRKSTRLNSSHVKISYAVFCLKKKTTKISQKLIGEDDDAIAVLGTSSAEAAAKAADSTKATGDFASITDPLVAKLVQSLDQPG